MDIVISLFLLVGVFTWSASMTDNPDSDTQVMQVEDYQSQQTVQAVAIRRQETCQTHQPARQYRDLTVPVMSQPDQLSVPANEPMVSDWDE